MFFPGNEKKLFKKESVFCSEESTVQNTIKISLFTRPGIFKSWKLDDLEK